LVYFLREKDKAGVAQGKKRQSIEIRSKDKRL
jgi:hypothetical protein